MKFGHLEGGITSFRGLTITMVINHLQTGMILQVTPSKVLLNDTPYPLVGTPWSIQYRLNPKWGAPYFGRLVGGFKHFLFSPLFGEINKFDLYFSDGLKPPTRRSFPPSGFWCVASASSKGIAFVVFDSAMAARRACGLSGEMFKAGRSHVPLIQGGPPSPVISPGL